MKNLLLFILFIILVCGIFNCYSTHTEYDMRNSSDVYPLIETGDYFYNGEILMPDYVHTDTLVVTDAEFLNKWLTNDEYEVGGDGDISDLLGQATVTTENMVLDLPEEYIANNHKNDLNVLVTNDSILISFK